MKRKSPLSYSWRALAKIAEERRAERASELERYWNESGHSGETFDSDKGHGAAAAQRQALRRIQAGQAVTDVKMARYLAFLETTQIAAEALGRPALTASPKNVGET
jgi:hypothetical protein